MSPPVELTTNTLSTAHLRERRSAPRKTCLREVLCRAVMSGRDESAPALLENYSNTGLRLALRRCYEPGRVLAVTWRESRGGKQHSLLAHVVYVRNEGGGTWSLGCALIGHSDDEQVAELL
jgi:hypothetical protein